MNKKNFLSGMAVILISISIVTSGYLISDAMKSDVTETKNRNESLKVLNLKQVAEYLNMTVEDVTSIIEIEQNELTNVGGFTGKMFPYFTVDDNLYFYKDEVDVWLQEVASNHRYYDTEKGYQVQ